MATLHTQQARISVIVPVLNEADRIAGTLDRLRSQTGCEIVIVDGGSTDGTREAASGTDRVIGSPPGRARQMNAGAAEASGDIFWFVHADSRVPPDGAALVREAIRAGAGWGRFDLRLDGRHPAFRVIERFINWRSALSGIATGDQAIFVTRRAFEAVGGYPDISLMEDVALCRALKKQGRPARINTPVISSSRRWERLGILRTTLLMWRLRYAYWRGADPDRLAALYAGELGRETE